MGKSAQDNSETIQEGERQKQLLPQREMKFGGTQTLILLMVLGIAVIPLGLPIWGRVLIMALGGAILVLNHLLRQTREELWEEHWKRRDLKKKLNAQQPRVQELEAQLDKHLRSQAEELAQAKEVQESLLPTELTNYPQLQFALYYRPSVSVGGDLYDLIPLSPRYVALYIADCSGHGVSAALMSVMLKFNMERHQDELKIAAENNLLTEEVLQRFVVRLNNGMQKSLQRGRFVSFLLVTLDVETGQAMMVNCGHNQPILWRAAEASIEQLEVIPNIVLGIVEGMEFEANSATLAQGDKLILYTDGITERTNPAGREWGIHNLLHTIRENADSEPEALLRQIMLENKTFCGAREADDDMAIVAVEFKK